MIDELLPLPQRAMTNSNGRDGGSGEEEMSPEEYASKCFSDGLSMKGNANQLFASDNYTAAIQHYEDAIFCYWTNQIIQ